MLGEPGRLLFLAVLFGVALAGVVGVLGMGGRRVGVVGSLFVVARLVLLGSLSVVLGGLGVVLSRVLVALCCFLRYGRRGG